MRSCKGSFLLPFGFLHTVTLQYFPPGHGKRIRRHPVEQLAVVQQDARPRPLAIFCPEGPQVRRVSEPWPPSGLDLDWQQAARSLNHEIDLFPYRSAPVEQLDLADSGVPPRHQVLQHQVLKMRPSRLSLLRQVHRHARVPPVQFR